MSVRLSHRDKFKVIHLAASMVALPLTYACLALLALGGMAPLIAMGLVTPLKWTFFAGVASCGFLLAFGPGAIVRILACPAALGYASLALLWRHIA
jgi:hypothetical protein